MSSTFDAIVLGRLDDFFRRGATWNRRLWSLGLVLSLKEVLEVSGAVAEKVVWEQSLDQLKNAVAITAAVDAGVGADAEHATLQASLQNSIVPGGFAYRHLEQLIAEIQGQYLDRWKTAVSGPQPPFAERTARAIAGHLLDIGFSQRYLEPWFDDLVTRAATTLDIIDAAQALEVTPAQDHEVLVPLGNTPGDARSLPSQWLDATRASAWLHTNGFSPAGMRLSGAFLFTIATRDPFSAAEQAGELLAGLQSRLNLTPLRALDPLGAGWIKGYPEPIPLWQRRGVDIDALRNTGTIYTIGPGSSVDAALDLLSSLDQGPPGTAAATAWASIESVLVGPGDTDRGLAAERCADIVLCSWPRAELTTLARVYQRDPAPGDHLAQRITAVTSNREAARLLEEAVLQGQRLQFLKPGDQAAYARMVRMCDQPDVSFAALRRHILTSLARLFRQRNMVLHSGRLAGIGLRPGLRVAAPLVAQGMNMIAYSWLRLPTDPRTPLPPLELAARARLRLDLINSRGRPFHDLLADR
jgi:hypothetical protein